MASTKKETLSAPSNTTDLDSGSSEAPAVNACKAELWHMADAIADNVKALGFLSPLYPGV